MYVIHLIEINFIPNCTVCFQSFFMLDCPFFQIILNILGLEHWWMADFKQVPIQSSMTGAVLTKFQPCFPQSLQWPSGESIQTRTWRVVSLILTWSSEFSKLSGVRLLPKYIACLNLQTVFNSTVLFTIFY